MPDILWAGLDDKVASAWEGVRTIEAEVTMEGLAANEKEIMADIEDDAVSEVTADREKVGEEVTHDDIVEIEDDDGEDTELRIPLEVAWAVVLTLGLMVPP